MIGGRDRGGFVGKTRGRCSQANEQPPCGFPLFSARRAKQTIVPDLDTSLRQDVLKKTLDEVDTRQGNVTNLMGLVIAIAESHGLLIDGFDSAVGDGNPEDVSRPDTLRPSRPGQRVGNERPIC